MSSTGPQIPGLPFLPPGTSFIFRVDELVVRQGNTSAQLDANMRFWTPPRDYNAFEGQDGQYYRWMDGEITIADATNTPHISWLNTHENCLWFHRCSTVFTLFPDTLNFVAVAHDVRRHNVPDNTEGHGWQTIGFDHIPLPGNDGFCYSEVGIMREFPHLASPPPPGRSWVDELFNEQYHFSAVQQGNFPHPGGAGLTGDLSIILALIAFSGCEEQLHTMLCHNLGRGTWTPHHQRNGRRKYRGVVVTIWLDSNTPTWVLNNLESGAYGAFLRP